MDALLQGLDYLIFDDLYARLVPLDPTTAVFDETSLKPTAANATANANATTAFASSQVSAWDRDNVWRQCSSLMLISIFGAGTIYAVFASLSYYFVFDRRLEYHPRFLKNQVAKEIKTSLFAIPFIAVLTLPFFLAEVRGKSLLYTRFDEYGWVWLGFSTLLYFLWNDIAIYWIHRLEHHQSIYKYIHKPHHKWIVPTPWAAIAFHPVDGFLQSLPYHIFVFICPMQKYLYMVLFVTVQLWTVLIHDGDMITGHWTEKFINSPAHHTMHHMYFTVNYGQYFTWADTYFDSHRAPEAESDPIHDALKVMRQKGLIDEHGNPVTKKTV